MSWLTLLKWQRNWNFCSRLQPEPGLRHIHRIAFHLAACRCPRSGMNRAAMEDGVDGMRTDGVSRVHGDGQYRPISGPYCRQQSVVCLTVMRMCSSSSSSSSRNTAFAGSDIRTPSAGYQLVPGR